MAAVWADTMKICGFEVSIQGGAGKTANLILAKQQIDEMADWDIVHVARAFAEYANEIGILNLGRQWNWDEQCFSKEELQVIMDGNLATEKEKGVALELIVALSRSNGMPARTGYVYLIGADTGLVKIGMSTDPDGRLKAIQRSSPLELKVIHTIFAGDMYHKEMDLHLRFSAKRKHGEWFDLSQEDIDYIKSL